MMDAENDDWRTAVDNEKLLRFMLGYAHCEERAINSDEKYCIGCPYKQDGPKLICRQQLCDDVSDLIQSGAIEIIDDKG